MNSGHFTSWSCSDGKEMYKQAQCTCRDVVLLIKNFKRFHSRCQQLRQFVATKEKKEKKEKKFNSHDQYWFGTQTWRMCVADVRAKALLFLLFQRCHRTLRSLQRAYLRCNVICYSQLKQNKEHKTSLTMDLSPTILIIYKTKKTNRLYYTGDDPYNAKTFL